MKYLQGISGMRTITIRIDDELKKRMEKLKINWSEYIRDAIRRRVELEERKKAARALLEGLRSGEGIVPKGFVEEALRELRGSR